MHPFGKPHVHHGPAAAVGGGGSTAAVVSSVGCGKGPSGHHSPPHLAHPSAETPHGLLVSSIHPSQEPSCAAVGQVPLHPYAHLRVVGGGPTGHHMPLQPDAQCSSVLHQFVALFHPVHLPQLPSQFCPQE